jgi:hypothetical protein
MRVYTVHEPPQKGEKPVADPERFAFVRDGFHFWAFLLTPLWMVWHRLWLVLVLYCALTAAIDAALYAVAGRGAPFYAVSLVIGLLVGFEAGTLRRWTLARRGWKNLGVVVGKDLEDAERRFFDAWMRERAAQRQIPAPVPPPAATTFRMPQAVTDIVGLFPEPGTRR